ncbi:protein virilizer homolog [Telopea speciosissima]|uniref:protein virilizer homolog n=1 Tax=Telopea speciosissima TaxID=54955 RepID=UPI001CC4E3C0|nr:protein virilizer homolog [Telopea speciosissima]
MGRPEPCVLFAQTFVHPQLDEYVDEVIFAEPVVITACEFLEQNASLASQVITLIGATSPPSFALEVFVQCEGETRFRRLCQPFLYSHSSSNMLEVEAVVTNHLVVRGSYRSLTLVVYGNTAEDLGQFNIDFDLDSSLANLVSLPSEGKLDDLPPVLRSTKLAFEESISSLKSLSLPIAEADMSAEIRQFVTLVLKILELSDLGDVSEKVADIVVSAVSSYVSSDLHGTNISLKQCKQVCSRNCEEKSQCVLIEARSELLQLFKLLQHDSGNLSAEILGEDIIFESEGDLGTSDLLSEVLEKYLCVKKGSAVITLPQLSQNKKMIVVLSIVLLLCPWRESCFYFVNGGGMEQLVHVFHLEIQKSTAVTLLVLGVVERATRHAIGCEGFLGWWPRENVNVPAGNSEGYSQILKLLLQRQCHDVASLATYILHRLRSYEVASRYESAVLSVLGGITTAGRVTNVFLSMLISARSQLKKLMKLINSCGPIEDPSPMACVRRSLILGQTEGLLTYKATIDLIASSKCCFSNWDIDPHLLSLLRERGFLLLSAALLSSAILRSEKGHVMDIFVDIASSIEAILLSLLFCRSGLIFLLLQPEVTATVILTLEGVEDMNKEDCIPLRYASVLISKGFYCRPQEVGMITEMHLRVVNAIDRLVTSTLHSEEFLRVLWELCTLSRSDCGRQALLSLGHFPEAISVLLEALHSVKELEPVTLTSGASPLNLAIFHSIAELFEVIVTDSTASSLGSWIEHAVELHKALHSSSPGSNRKDAPTRLLEWIDAGAVYQKSGAVGLLRYAAVLASGGDAHLTSTSVLVSDSMDVENVVGDSASGFDVQVVENLLGKLVADRHFEGVTLRDSSVAQLTTTFRILAFIAENSVVAAALYEEGAVTLIYVILVNCKSMLERSANTYDYLVDEGAECNSTSDLLLERSREQSLVDLLIPSLVLLITLLQKLQDAKEQHRNTKLLNALLRLHREVSPKLAACAADLSCPYPGSALGLGAVCHLIVSALACWPIYGWTPGLFHCLLDSVQATSSLALGPKEACSLLCLLSDLFPEEVIWLWKNGIPSLSAIRTLAVGTLLGPEKERQIDWYLQPGNLETILSRLMPLLDKIGQIVLHFAFTTLVVIQDMLRVFIIRIACQRADSALVLLRPLISWIQDHISESSPASDMDIFKVYRLLDFLACLLEHPQAKTLLLKQGIVRILITALERSFDTLGSDRKLFSEGRIPTKSGSTLHSWCLPVFKSFALIFDSRAFRNRFGAYDKSSLQRMSTEECSLILLQVLKFCQVLPVGRELVACLTVFKELASCCEGRSAFISTSAELQASTFENLEPKRRRDGDANDAAFYECGWIKHPPLLYCCRNLLRSIDGRDGLIPYAIEAARSLFSGGLFLCMEGKNFNMEGVAVLKCLFGLPHDFDGTDDSPPKNSDLEELIVLLNTTLNEDEKLAASNLETTLSETLEFAKSILFLLQKPIGSFTVDDICSGECVPSSSSDVQVHSKILPPHLLFPSLTMKSILNDEVGSSLLRIMKPDSNAEKTDDFFSLGGLTDKFLWECPESSSDRLPALPVKRKIASVEVSNRRSRVEGSGSEVMGPTAFSRGLGLPSASSAPTRRDTFRQRKPNTSRPPSMHVDDYVARERNTADGVSSSSNVVGSIQRGGSTSGRPPSIHVDEFMARQRERQNLATITVGEPAAPNKNAPPENEIDSEKFDRSQQLKADLDDDLQELDIVFDDEEAELDDRIPFPQPDDNLQPAPVNIGESPPHSIVEETESDVNESTQFSHLGTPSTSNVVENTRSEFSSTRSVSRSEMALSQEASISSEKYMGPNGEKPFFQEQSDEIKNAVPVIMPSGRIDSAATANLSGLPSPFYNKGFRSVQMLDDSRATPPTFYQRASPQQALNTTLATGSQGPYEQKPLLNQPPLPPLPPPPMVSSITSQTAEPVQSHSSPFGHSMRDLQPPMPTGYPLQAFDGSGPSALPAFHDSKYLWASASPSSRLHDEINTSSGSARPPPLPPTPPPYSASSVTQTPLKTSSQSSGFSQTSAGTPQLPLTSAISLSDTRSSNFSASGGLISYSPPPPPLPPLLPNRPTSMPGNFLSSMATQQQGQNLSGLLHSVTSQAAIQLAQPRVQLQPLQPPQPPRTPHPQHIRPPIQVSQQQSDQGVSLLHGPIQVLMQPLQMPQSHISPVPVYYQPQQPDHISQPLQQQGEHVQPQTLYQHGDNSSQQHQDSGMSLQEYFSSPEAIQSLLSDREKLCELLEQHPKLMQMLQERLGQH